MIEISGNRTKESKLKKNYPEHYAIYEKQIKDIFDARLLLDVPPGFP